MKMFLSCKFPAEVVGVEHVRTFEGPTVPRVQTFLKCKRRTVPGDEIFIECLRTQVPGVEQKLKLCRLEFPGVEIFLT